MIMRYPGAKSRLKGQIMREFPARMNGRYVEPFVGAGGIAVHALGIPNWAREVWLNDLDYGVASLWVCIRDQPGELCDRILAFEPSLTAYDEFKAIDGDRSGNLDPGYIGFAKLALHQISYSGLGAKSGGPIGGRDQAGAKYKIDCRWNPARLCARIAQIHKKLQGRKVEITSRRFQDVLREAEGQDFFYIDPPYVQRGAELYKHAMTERDHMDLASLAQALPCRWVVSYDDCEFVRQLYFGYDIKPISATYTINRDKSRSGKADTEILIVGVPS